jgi:hypothetical protein
VGSCRRTVGVMSTLQEDFPSPYIDAWARRLFAATGDAFATHPQGAAR